MFILDTAVVTSPSDLKTLSDCEFAFARRLDAKLGRLDEVPVDDDPMLKRAGQLGDVHEGEQLARYRQQHPGDVVEFIRPGRLTRETLRAAADETEAALRGGAAVVFQATFFDESDPDAPTIGFADFLVRQPDGRYRVQDTKLARSVKVTALLQLAAYHGHLVRLGIPVDDVVELLLGDGTVSQHRIDEIEPVYRLRVERLREVIAARHAAGGPAEWGDPDLAVDGRCVHCAEQVAAHDDLLQVAGIRRTQRAKLIDAGIDTLAALAATPQRPADCGIPETTYRALHQQARLQHQGVDADGKPRIELVRPQVIADLPAPDPGDLFFDFEGDPLWRGELHGDPLWGIDYLFGMVDVGETFTSLWAHDLAAEKQALRDFLDLVAARRVAHPGIHIYHYASYERTHLLSIAARHGEGEREVDELLRDNVLVDLYPVVKKMLRVGVPSYSIKKLEPLYMGDEHREAEVTNAVGSVEEYQKSREAELAGDAVEAQRILDEIADYNRYDCVSTLRLRDWMLALAASRGILPGTTALAEVDRAPFEESPLARDLERRALDADAAGAEQDAHAFRLAAAAIDYHRRENKSFWWEHYARLDDPVELWADQRGVFLVERIEIESDWAPARTRRSRTLRLHGTWAPGSGAVRDSGDVFLVYDTPVPFLKPGRAPGSRLDVDAKLVEQHPDADYVRVIESVTLDAPAWSDVPLALTPGPPPKADNLVTAIEEFAAGLPASADPWPRRAAADVLLRRAPVTSGGLEPADSPDDTVRAVVASLQRLDRSYLAVQGPPGTGKTYVAAHTIRALVAEHGWRIGVVAQSHRVVEHVLDEIVAAGLPAQLVGKVAPSEKATGYYSESRFTEIPKDKQAEFADRYAGTGYVLGGTAWDFTNLKRVKRDQLDLLVIDEAGQFSLAATIAVAVSAKRLLLLGDPQQLPQVSQGTHPAPVDGSALGHIGDGRDVLPLEFGYFLAESRRMHPALAEVVSRLSYDGELGAHETAGERHLDGIEAGLHPVPVAHAGDSTSSQSEADEVLAIVERLLGTPWRESARESTRPLGESDVIVVTPYNAQLDLIRETLDANGLTRVRVGTVDKFQGQEAVVSIVSLAASSADDVPRGLSFLLSRNRLNVAISRAQWASYLVYSPTLLEHLPHTPDGVVELSRFVRLVGE